MSKTKKRIYILTEEQYLALCCLKGRLDTTSLQMCTRRQTQGIAIDALKDDKLVLAGYCMSEATHIVDYNYQRETEKQLDDLITEVRQAEQKSRS